jgi:hypothetical protein
MRLGYILLIVVLITSCTSPEEEGIPENVLSPEKFTSVMIDVQITEGMRAQGVDIITPGEGVEGAYEEIFSKHQINKEAFDESYNYYLDHPDQMEKIYEQVLDSLSKLDAQVKQKFSAERKARTDSISEANKKK